MGIAEGYDDDNDIDTSSLHGEWVEVAPMTEGQCSYAGCTEPAVWDRKEGWMVAPGSPPGAVCETHHCWERIENRPKAPAIPTKRMFKP